MKQRVQSDSRLRLGRAKSNGINDKYWVSPCAEITGGDREGSKKRVKESAGRGDPERDPGGREGGRGF